MTDTLSRGAAAVRPPGMLGAREQLSLLIVFLDFTEFDRQSERVDDIEIAETLDAHYERVSAAIYAAGGRVVKFMGDATMAVFREPDVDAGVRAIFEIRESEDLAMAALDWPCRLHAKAHFGAVVAGDFGPRGDRRFDVLGKAVNAAARLKTTGFTISAAAYDRLVPELQRRFKHQSATQTYVAD